MHPELRFSKRSAARFAISLGQVSALILSLVGTASLPTSSVAANLIVNGGFESPGGGFATLYTGSTALAPWEISGSVELIPNGVGPTSWPAHEGDYSLDLAGTSNGTIQQSFATVPGKQYTLTFQYGNNWGGIGSTGVVRVIGSSPIYGNFITHGGSTSTDMQWTPYEATFVANSTITSLSFEDLSLSVFYGIALDAIAVTPVVVPEPVGLSLVCIAGAAFCRFSTRFAKSTRT